VKQADFTIWFVNYKIFVHVTSDVRGRRKGRKRRALLFLYIARINQTVEMMIVGY